MSLPSGIVTFLYTDVEGSTSLWERQPEAMRTAIACHDAILRRAVEVHGGIVFRTAGDAFCAAFATAAPAVAAAVEAQQALVAEPWPFDQPLRVRFALHTTEAEAQGGDYVGSGLNRLGRLLAVCHGGQILLTQAIEQLVRDHLPAGASLVDLGLHRFRDLAHPDRIFQIAAPGLPGEFPPLKSLEAMPNNLPAQLTSFVGRERELAELTGHLSPSLSPSPPRGLQRTPEAGGRSGGGWGEGARRRGERLLTLTGPGGTGKTRLALQAAARVLEHFSDGVWLAALAPLTDPALVLPSLAAAIGLREQPGRPLQAQVADYLRDKLVLLVLDNCEHLIETCAQIADDLLHACPRLHILASSREPLGIAGEVVVRVPSLAVPSAHSRLAFEDLAQFEAVRLFVERASAVQPRFRLTPQNAPAVVQICQRLDGIPLAIELAAARAKLLSPEQIAARLDDRFRLLTGGSRTALPRQQTLEALIDWSYDLLAKPEQVLFRRLSVFAGGWSLEAAEAVASGQAVRGESGKATGGGLQSGDVLDLLYQLVNKSLVVADDTGEEVRYRMLETIRQYALDRLLASSEAAWVRDQHLAYYDRFTQGAWDGLGQRDRLRWVRLVQIEQDNLLAALEWALDYDLDAALRMVAALPLYWTRIGASSEHRRYVQQALAEAGARPEYQAAATPARKSRLASALAADALYAFGLGENSLGAASAKRAVELARESSDREALAFALLLQAEGAAFQGQVELMQACIEEGLALARQAGDKRLLGGIASAINPYTARAVRDFEELHTAVQEGSRVLEELGDPWGRGLSLIALAAIDFHRDELDAADAHLREAMTAFQNVGDVFYANLVRSGLADVARQRGEYAAAIQLYGETMASWRNLGNRGAIARCLECLGFMAIEQAQMAMAGTSAAYLRRAANLFGAASAIRRAGDAPMMPDEQVEYDSQATLLRSLVKPEEFAAAWQTGLAMSLDEAMAFGSRSNAG